jgi:quinol monooxygenase YgiN
LIKHIVMWKLKDAAEGRDRPGNAAEMKRVLEALKGIVPGILELEVGTQFEANEAAYDVVLYSVFKDKAGLEVYMKHPEHLKVVEFVRKVVSDRKVVDYEV